MLRSFDGILPRVLSADEHLLAVRLAIALLYCGSVTVHSGYSYYRGGGGIPIGAYLPPNMDIKIFFIKIIKFDFSLLQIMYILTQA